VIRKAVIPAAGLGTRLLPATKEMPKEMLPIFVDGGGEALLKPILQAVFEQLFDAGFREFCIIVGRGKRAIEDHFTSDYDFIDMLNDKGKEVYARSLEAFYGRLEASRLVWVNQPAPKGFGHAVLMAESYTGVEPFLLVAGDTCIVSRDNGHIMRLIDAFEGRGAEVALVTQTVEDPRKYGVVLGEEMDEGHMLVRGCMEKPEEPVSKHAIMPLYVFKPSIYEALKQTPPGKDGEIQLTDGIDRLIKEGRMVLAVKMRGGETGLDIGTPQTYWEALSQSYTNNERKGWRQP